MENNAADIYVWSYKWFVFPLFMQDYKGRQPKRPNVFKVDTLKG